MNNTIIHQQLSEKVLGLVMGARPVRYEEMVKYLETLDQSSPEVLLREYGQTHEGRKLYFNLHCWGEVVSVAFLVEIPSKSV